MTAGYAPEEMGGISRGVLFVADGVGMVFCYDLSTSELMYGMGACSEGAVRCMGMVGYDQSFMYACGEDGNVLLYEH
jgi:hypothetical protein